MSAVKPRSHWTTRCPSCFTSWTIPQSPGLSRELGLLVALAAVVVCVPLAQSALSKLDKSGRIAFQSDRDTGGTNSNIYTVNPDGSDLVRLTYNSSGNFGVAWSPDGKKLAFVSDRDGNLEIYVMNDDGSGQTNLTNSPATDEAAPSWSADGKKIAFHSRVNATTVDINFMNADGSHATRVPNQPAGVNNFVTWMGKDKLLFTHSADNDEIGPVSVQTIRTNGKDLRQLTPDSLNAGLGDWTEHGDMVTFVDNFCDCPASHVYTMKADGTKIKKIENTDTNNLFPHWSPDGKQITFSGTTPTFSQSDIYTINADGSNLLNVTNDSSFNFRSSWGCPDKTCKK